jgi:hypothetical protein
VLEARELRSMYGPTRGSNRRLEQNYVMRNFVIYTVYQILLG